MGWFLCGSYEISRINVEYKFTVGCFTDDKMGLKFDKWRSGIVDVQQNFVSLFDPFETIKPHSTESEFNLRYWKYCRVMLICRTLIIIQPPGINYMYLSIYISFLCWFYKGKNTWRIQYMR